MVLVFMGKKEYCMCRTLLSGLHDCGLWLMHLTVGEITPEDAAHRSRRKVNQHSPQTRTTELYSYNAGRESPSQFICTVCVFTCAAFGEMCLQ